MKPGRELDALVAEKVMGWSPVGDEFDGAEFAAFLDAHPYSTDIAAAWEVFEKIQPAAICHAKFGGKNKLPEWVVARPDDMGDEIATAPTAPHAICLAALNAVGVEVG